MPARSRRRAKMDRNRREGRSGHTKPIDDRHTRREALARIRNKLALLSAKVQNPKKRWVEATVDLDERITYVDDELRYVPPATAKQRLVVYSPR